MVDILEGAEPQSWSGDNHGVLVLHGFTGSPHSVRPWAQAFANAGYTVELPLLPGHGTTVEDMIATSWTDWSAAAEDAYQRLAEQCDLVMVAGLSMGGTLTAWLAARHPEIVGIELVNPAVMPQPEMEEMLRPMMEAGEITFDAIGSDIAMEGIVELAYDRTPLGPLVSLSEAIDDLQPLLESIVCPVLLMTSPQDHVVVAASSDHFASQVGGTVERVSLDRSFHVATLDFDAPLIEERSVEFASRVFD